MTALIVVIGLSILVLVHEAGHFFAAKAFGIKVEEFGFGFPPRLFGKKKGETLYSINALPIGGFVKIHGEDGDVVKDKERSFALQSVWKRILVVAAGVLMNILIAWFFLSTIFMIGTPQHLIITDVAKDSPAGTAGLKNGDVVMAATWDGRSLADPVGSNAFIDLVKNAKGSEIALKIMRGKETLNISLQARANPPEGQGPLGVSLVGIGVPRESFLTAIADGFTTAFYVFFLAFKGFINFFLSLFVSPQVVQSVSGPVGIFAIAGQAGALGFVYLLQLIALISLNLAALNLLPIPALDGGRIIFLIAEKIKGSPVSYAVQRWVNATGFVFLLLLMAVVTFEDVVKLLH